MATYGIESFDKVGSGITVTADGAPKQKHGGITIDWSSVAAHSVDTMYLDFDYVKAGEKFIRYGTIMCRLVGGTNAGKFVPYGVTPVSGTAASAGKGDWFILNRSVHEEDRMSDHVEAIEGGRVYANRLDVEDLGAIGNEVQTITLGAGNTGGDFTITFSGQTTSAIAYDATGADVQTALIALSNIATGDVTVTGGAGGPYVVTFAGAYANTNVPAMTTTPSLTGGANTAVVTVTSTTGPSLADFNTAFPNIVFATES